MSLSVISFFLLTLLHTGNSQGQFCLTSATCDLNKICVNSRCNFCRSDLQCKNSLPAKPYCKIFSGRISCEQCLMNSHCTSPAQSRCLLNSCAPCLSQSDCAHIPGAKNQCWNGVCVGCFDNSHCASGICDMTTHQCQSPSCPCSLVSNTPFCSGTYCEECGVSQTFCSSMGLKCAPDGSCQQCWENTQCNDPVMSKCENNSCRRCSEDAHCLHISGMNKCESSSQGCVECLNSADCAPGKTCTNNVCSATSTVPLEITLSETLLPNIYKVNFPVELVTNALVEQGVSIQLIGIDPKIYAYHLTKITETQYEVHFQVNQSVPRTLLHLVYTFYSQMHYNANSQEQWVAQIDSKRMPYIDEEGTLISRSIETSGTIIVLAMAITGGSIMLLGGNPTLLWIIVGLIQTFYYLSFINVNYPGNIQFFLRIFLLGKAEFIPNPIEWFYPDIEKESLPAPTRFQEYDVNGLFLAEAGNMILVAFGIFLLYGFSLIIKSAINRLSRLITLLFTKICLWFHWSGALRGLITSYPELTQAAFLQLRELNFGTSVFSTSSVFGIFFSIYGIVFPILTFLLVRELTKDNKKISRKYIGLVEDYSTEGTYPKYFTSVFLAKRLVIAASLVFLHDYSYVEISFLVLQSVTTMLLLFKFKPYPTKLLNSVNSASELLFVIVHILIFVLIHDDHVQTFSEISRLNIGWGIIAICSIILAANIFVTLFELMKTLNEYWHLFKKLFPANKYKKKPKVKGIVPIDKFELKDIIPQVNSDSISIVTSNLSFIHRAQTTDSIDAPIYLKRRKAPGITGQSLMIDHIQELVNMQNMQNLS